MAAVAAFALAGFLDLPALAALGLLALGATGLVIVSNRNPYGASAAVAIASADGGADVSVREHAGIAELDQNARVPAHAWRPAGFVNPAGSPARLALDGLGRTTRLAANRRTLVQLEIDREVERYPWERLLDYAADGERLATVLPYRREPGVWHAISWATWLRRASYRRQCVTHVVGTPVEAYGGVRMRLPGGQADRLDVTRLVGSRPAVVILQTEPVDGPPRPLGDLHVGFLRLARSALDGGANAVLVIPPLPDPLMEQVSAAVSARLRRRLAPPRPRHLPPLLAQLKRLTADAGGGDDAVLDLLLFLHTHD
jgi:hypothetical protein